MSRYATVSTPVLDIAYLEWNPRGQQVAVLVHGWPDCPEGWEPVAERLAAAGYRGSARRCAASARHAFATR